MCAVSAVALTLCKGGGHTPHLEQSEQIGGENGASVHQCEGLEKVQTALCPELVEDEGGGGIEE